MIYQNQRIEGFVCSPWLNGAQGNFLVSAQSNPLLVVDGSILRDCLWLQEDMSGWIKEGKVKVEETLFEGAEAYGDGFQSLFTGGNYGKVVVTTARAKM